MDAIDGKQARRTGTSGPLGELFDHGKGTLAKKESVKQGGQGKGDVEIDHHGCDLTLTRVMCLLLYLLHVVLAY
jgi:hypothetical protein